MPVVTELVSNCQPGEHARVIVNGSCLPSVETMTGFPGVAVNKNNFGSSQPRPATETVDYGHDFLGLAAGTMSLRVRGPKLSIIVRSKSDSGHVVYSLHDTRL